MMPDTPALLDVLPVAMTLTNGTVFLVLLSLSVMTLVWGVVQIAGIASDGGGRLERRLGLREVHEAVAPDGALLRPQDHPAWIEQSAGLQKLAERLELLSRGQTLTRFFATMAICGVIAGALGTLLLGLMPYGIVAALAGASVPYLRFRRAYGKRRKILAEQLEDALDLLSRVLRAGHSLSSGIQMVGTELPDPLAAEFRRCHEQHNFGQPMEEALAEMARRMDLEDVAFFVTSVSIQRQTGGDLAEILDNISTVIRGRTRLAQHIQALTAEGRATGYILTALPVLLFCLMFLINPEYAGALLTDSIGRLMLLAAVVLQVFGLLVIRRIVNIRV